MLKMVPQRWRGNKIFHSALAFFFTCYYLLLTLAFDKILQALETFFPFSKNFEKSRSRVWLSWSKMLILQTQYQSYRRSTLTLRIIPPKVTPSLSPFRSFPGNNVLRVMPIFTLVILITLIERNDLWPKMVDLEWKLIAHNFEIARVLLQSKILFGNFKLLVNYQFFITYSKVSLFG